MKENEKMILNGPPFRTKEEEDQFYRSITIPIEKSEFIKADADKNMLGLIEPQFVLSLGDVLTYGAKKYAINNWRLCEDTSRYKDAALRHLYAYLSGEQKDQETNIEHLAHCACNLMFLQYFDNKKEQKC